MDQKNPKINDSEMSVQKASELAKQLESGGTALSDDALFQGFKR